MILLTKQTTIIDSCSTIHLQSQNPPSNIAKLYLSPPNSYQQPNPQVLFVLQHSYLQVNPPIARFSLLNHSKAPQRFGIAPKIPKNQTAPRTFCVMDLISSHRIWQFEREKVERMRTFKLQGFRSLFSSSMGIQVFFFL